MTPGGEGSGAVEQLRHQTERDRAELSDTVQELADRLDVKRQAGRVAAALPERVGRWLREHRRAGAVLAAAATVLVVYVWRRRFR